MKMPAEQIHRIMALCGALRDGVITEAEFAELDTLLRQNPEAQDIYLDYIYLCTDLCNLQAAIKLADAEANEAAPSESADSAASPLTLEMLKVLGDYERRAETVEIPEPEETKQDLIRKVSLERPPRSISKFSLVTLITSLAALLFVLVYVHLNSPVSFEVATLSGSVDAEWSSSLPPQKGLRFSVSSEMYHLQKGVIEIESDKGVRLLLEAPAGFSFSSPDEICMDYGRVFASVSPAGNGFSVQTRSSKVIDLGTEFGVYSDLKGETELHVYRGNTLLITGRENTPKRTMEVAAGKAMRIDRSAHAVTDIRLSNRMFVQKIDPALGLYWRGRKALSIADMAGGGAGMGTGLIGSGINPSSRMEEEPSQERYRPSSNRYNPIFRNPFIDGVFVPDGSDPQVVSSAGHLFRECPETSGFFYSNIVYADLPLLLSIRSDESSDDPDPIGFVGEEDLVLYMHANAGVTFDLNQIRYHKPGIQISGFQSKIGIMKSARDKPVPSRAEFWVLVDGAVRCHQTLQPEMSDTIDVELRETDGFLTLVTTDGGSLETELDRHAIGHDLCVFIDPILALQ